MKVIFLDIDGVLNCANTKDTCGIFLGIDDTLVKRLKSIVDQTYAEIVLCSSWKSRWYKDHKTKQSGLADYLDKKLEKQGLKIFDKTKDHGNDRGHGIQNYLKENNIFDWCVIDDEIFEDYEECDIMSHLVKTEFHENGGLQTKHIEKAVKILNKDE